MSFTEHLIWRHPSKICNLKVHQTPANVITPANIISILHGLFISNNISGYTCNNTLFEPFTHRS